MSWFKKDPEPRSWNGDTAAELAEGSNDEKPYTPPKCTDSRHITPVEVFRDEKRGFKKMTCRHCGADWTEKL